MTWDQGQGKKSQLAPNSMTLNDLERQNRVFMDFLAILD